MSHRKSYGGAKIQDLVWMCVSRTACCSCSLLGSYMSGQQPVRGQSNNWLIILPITVLNPPPLSLPILCLSGCWDGLWGEIAEMAPVFGNEHLIKREIWYPWMCLKALSGSPEWLRLPGVQRSEKDQVWMKWTWRTCRRRWQSLPWT